MFKSFSILWLLSASALADPVNTYLPVPSQAVGPPLNAAGYRVESYGKGAYMVTNNQYQAMFFVSDKGVIVVDAPPTIGYNLLYAIGNITDQPITHQVYSHSHTDHIGGSGILPSGVKRIAHYLTKVYLEDTPDANRPLPDEIFADAYTLTVGNQTLELKYEGHNHHPGNIFIYAPVQKVLILIDIIFPGWVPYSALGATENVAGYIKAHDQALAYDFDVIVTGHLTRSGNRKDVEISKAYVLDLEQTCTEAYQIAASPGNNISAQAIAAATLAVNPNNPYTALKAILTAMAEYCGNKTNGKFQDVIAGTDVYGFENAFKMTDSLRIELDAGGPFAVKGP
ncbi:Metallo-hydrolase/oxidoreductase [Microthyrium microscopicum]|uniref:Metallo-hydrolase/oxidoreductase n=1 Tax=Microthyrium microscopicum TaxID=703497 RepID=A0A6A6TXA7_9PEZI|nr:Metallo-hydrolase/oxidoreductase [Microthyrium microscopicum]